MIWIVWLNPPLTVTVVCNVVCPPGPLSVSVYVVVVVGETETDPPETGVTLPTPLLIEADVAPELVHVSVEELPLVIEVGDAENVPLGAGVPAAWTTWVRLPAAS